MDYSKYSRFFIRGLCHLMLSILHQIHIFFNSRLGSFQPSFYASNCIRTKPSRRASIKLGRHWFTRLWLSSSSHYPGYLMKKLMSITRKGSQLHPTGFSISPPTVVPKSGEIHTSICRQSADKLDNLSCIRISEWEYFFRVIYVLR